MASLNKVILIGNLGAHPDIKNTATGGKVAVMKLATNETWNDKTTGERRKRTEWHRVVIFSEPLVRIAEQYLRKGSSLYVEGTLRTRKWTGQDGVERYTTEIHVGGWDGKLVLLDKPSQQRPQTQSPAPEPAQPQEQEEPQTVGDMLDDEVPF